VPRWAVRTFINSLGRGRRITIIAPGIDLAKNIFAVHGVNQGGAVCVRQPKVARAKLGPAIAALPPDVIGMETEPGVGGRAHGGLQGCSGAHYWARQFQAHGHTVRQTGPKLVASYRMTEKRDKNDAADAEPGDGLSW
jgi:transposase